jgi:hypothetical protein
VLLGQEKGPRFGSFVAVYGLGNTVEMIDGALVRSSEQPAEGDMGKLINTSKQLAATRQIEAAIAHFKAEEYESAFTLAGAAEGLLPETKEPHIFSALRASPKFKSLDLNRIKNWLKHPTPPDQASISEFETVLMIMRAITKVYAVYEVRNDVMEEFGRWAFQVGHLPTPETWSEKAK